MTNDSKNDLLRVSLHEHEMSSLMDQYPKLTRTEIADVITRHGPMRAVVEAELSKVSGLKR